MAEDLKLFEKQQVRSSYNEDSEKWYFSIIDIISILTESKNPRRYWSDLKIKLSDEEGFSQLYEKIVQLKLTSSDGKKYNTDCADVETLLRIIQSVPSKKAEPVKQWLARVGYERMKELADPSTALDRARDIWQKQGRSAKWCLSGTSLVGVVHGVRVAPSLAFYGSDPMRLLTVPDLLLNIELAYCTGSTSSRSQLTI